MINPLNSFSNCLIARVSLCLLVLLRFGADNRIVEGIHLFKTLMTVSSRMLNSLVYGEAGRYPLYICTYTRYIKYWLNTLRMHEDRIPLKSYKMLYNMHCNNKNNWASCVCFTLYRYGHGHGWENQGVCNMSLFM